MKRARRVLNALLALALCAGLLTGCGGAAGGTAASAPAAAPEASMDQAASAAGGTGGESALLIPADGRRIIYNASLEMETLDFDAARQALLAAAEKAGAWVQSSDGGGSAENGDRWTNYTFRVPSEQYGAFLSGAEAAGSVTWRSESTDDVTAEYVDLEARLESLRAQETRLLELAAQAQDLTDLLAIEDQLTQVRYEIESYTGQQRVLDSLLDYSTVDISLSEVRYLTPVEDSFGARVSAAFAGSWENFVDGVQTVVIGVIYLLPFLVLAALAVLAVLAVLRLARRRRPPKPPAPPIGPKAPAEDPAGKQPPQYGPRA